LLIGTVAGILVIGLIGVFFYGSYSGLEKPFKLFLNSFLQKGFCLLVECLASYTLLRNRNLSFIL
ncbi:hypothetical protein BAE44_0013757, partial [Dichanthelium oligosanthes]